jgi:HPt (histidine-containing phosphotransfer) domain-containing protein
MPVIALTADATGAGREACLAAGMDDYLAKPFSRAALHAALTRWLATAPQNTPQPSSPDAHSTEAPVIKTAVAAAIAPAPNELLLDPTTLNALRALPRRGPKDMLSHIAERYLTDSGELVGSIERALELGNAEDLARAAHAWRSYNGNVGAHALARLCRELEDNARLGNFSAAREVFARIRALHGRVREQLQFEMRKSA